MFAKSYIAVALPCVIASALFVPPNQIPDEMTHLLRAAQVAAGSIQGMRLHARSAGGLVDAGVADFAAQHADWTKPPPQPTVQPAFSGTAVYAYYPNTVRYLPVLYTPSIAALTVGRWLGCTVTTAFYAARLLNGAAAVALGALALAMARRGRWLLLTLGLMPMALFEMGSVSQDAGMIGLVLFVAALITRLPDAGLSAYWGLAAAVTLLAGARPPLLALILLAGLRGWSGIPRLHRWAAPLACCALVLAWCAFTGPLQVPMREGLPETMTPQLQFLAHQPEAVPKILFNTFFHPDTNWLKTFIGVLGWLTVPLSASAYWVSSAALLLAALSCTQEPNPLRPLDRAIVMIAAAATFAGILGTTYLTWTPVGTLRVEGIQGRYFYNFLPLTVAILPVWGLKSSAALLLRRLGAVLLAWCLLWSLRDAAAASAIAWPRCRQAPLSSAGISCLAQRRW